MQLAPALLEHWLRDRYFSAEIDLGCSGVENYSLAQVREMVGLGADELDAIVFDDSRSYGGAPIRAAIASRWIGGAAERVMVTHGSSEAIFLVMHALLRPGDEVVVLDPGYHSLCLIAESIGCVLRPWRLRFERGFAPDVAEARALIGPRTRMVIANFPHNPTGASLTHEQQRELIDAAAEVGAYLAWDAAFGDLCYDQPPLPDPGLHYERAISFGTLSKAYGLPGLRVGWCIAPPDVLERCIHLRDYMTLHLSPLVELIAQRVIEHADRLVGPRLAQARHNRALLGAWVAQHPGLVEWAPPQGGVTAFVRLPAVADVDGFCERLAAERGVLLVPGSCFGHPSYVRLGFGGPTADLQAGLERLSGMLRDEAARAS